MNSLARLKAIIDGDGYHLCILNDTSKLQDLIELQLINQPIQRLHQFSYDNSRQIILASQKEKTDYLTIKEMEEYKDTLLKIHKKKDLYQRIIILYYLEHPALVNNHAFFPDELINEQDGWKVHHFHNMHVNAIDIDSCEESRLFQTFSYCLYDKKRYKSVELVGVVNNIQKVKIIPKLNTVDQRDIIKYDSINNIQRGIENEQMIYSLLTSEFTYKRRAFFLLKGEYTGAMSICADKYDSTSLEEKIKTTKDDKQIESLFNSIFKSFDSLYSRHDPYKPDGLNTPPLELYIKNTLSVVLELVSLQIPFEPAGEDKPLSKISWVDLFNDSYKEVDYYIFELIDIIPDFIDINQYKLIFGLNVSIENKTISCCASFTDRRDQWREIFNKEGIQTGNKYRLNKVKFENFLSPYFDTITDLQQLIYNEVPSLTIEEQYPTSYRDTLTKKGNKTIQLVEDTFANPGSILQDTKILKQLIKDQSQLVYGNANLSTIAFLEKSENLQNSSNDDRKTFHPFFSDLSSMGSDYPASFDMAKLEFEIKNNIIANHLLADYYRTNTRQWVSLLFCIEQHIQSETVNTTLFQDIDPGDTKRIHQMIFLIRKIRKKAYNLYKRGSEKPSEFENEVIRRYLQQLLFYSLGTLTNKIIDDPSRYYATISALYTATELFSSKEFTFYESKPSDGIDNKKKSNCHEDQKCLNKHDNRDDHTNKTNIGLKKDISIFLASSKELQPERDGIDLLIANMNRSLHKKGLFLNLIKWEDQNASFNKTRKQEDFNRKMLTCDVVIVLFYQKVGKFTHEEFRRAYENLKHGNKPNYLFVYFKKFDYSEASPSDLKQIMELQSEIEGYDQFHKFFSSVDDLKYDIQKQLDLIVNLSPLTIINQIINKDYEIFTQVDLPFEIIEQIEKVYDAQNGNNQFFKFINDLYYGEAQRNQNLSDAMYHIIMNYFYDYKLRKGNNNE